MKRRSPIQVLFESVECVSLANGQITVTPKWRCGEWRGPEEGGGPGLFTRMAGAKRLEKFINAHLASLSEGKR